MRQVSDSYHIHNDENGKSRPLTDQEIIAVTIELPQLADEKVLTVYADVIESIEEKP